MTEQEMKQELGELLKRFPWRTSPNVPGWWIFQDHDGVPKVVRVSDPESEKDDPETVWIRLPIEKLHFKLGHLIDLSPGVAEFLKKE